MWLLIPALVAATTTPVTLLGIVWSDDSKRTAAILASDGRQRVARVGEPAFGGTVVSITENVVIVRYGEGNVELRLPAGTAAARPSPAKRRSARTPAESPRSPGRVMARAEVERRLQQEVPRILAETTLVPVTEPGGRVAGVTLSRVAENTVLSDAGLLPGDVLTEINGVHVDGIATLAALYPRLQTEREIRAVVLRDGRPVALTVTLR